MMFSVCFFIWFIKFKVFGVRILQVIGRLDNGNFYFA